MSIKDNFSNLKAKMNAKFAVGLGAAASSVGVLSVTAFAAETTPTTGVAITTDMLKPLIDSVTANIGVILPVGIAIFGILIGVSLVPSLIKKFAKH